ncbi:MAG TPA: hypothetical protein VFJ67_01525 [Thermodesulfobacteriota bacterium]|jgi:hypothetical protein|nr:hypothetical protein [Thermodesulfobacteriota bacterium]
MKKSIIFGIAAMSLAFLFTANDSFADRDATPYEAAAVYGALKSQGCTVADDIEFEPFGGEIRYRPLASVYREDVPEYGRPGIFKTEAICSDGERYDIKLDSRLNILSMDPD